MNSNDSRKQNRKFGFTIGITLIIFAVLRALIKHKYGVILPVAGITMILVTLLIPVWLTSIRLIWERLGHVFGIINTYILLTIFYFLIVTPLGLIMRLFGQDVLKLKYTDQNTYWEPTASDEGKEIKNQF